MGYLCEVESGISLSLKDFDGRWEYVISEMSRPVCMNVNLSDFRVPIVSQIHMVWQWLSDRICVGYLCGVESGISLSLKDFGGS